MITIVKESHNPLWIAWDRWRSAKNGSSWKRTIPKSMQKWFEKNRAETVYVGPLCEFFLNFHVDRGPGQKGPKGVHFHVEYRSSRVSGTLGLPYDFEDLHLWLDMTAREIDSEYSEEVKKVILSLWRKAPKEITQGTPLGVRTRKAGCLDE